MNVKKIGKNEHWSYTIMGNWIALDYYDDFFYFCSSAKTNEETQRIRNQELRIKEFWKVLIDRCYDKLIDFVENKGSRLVYLVLGFFLMEYGGRMTKEVKEKILEYSQWKYEIHQFKSESEKELRKKYLSEYRDKVHNYKDGIYTVVSKETLEDVYQKHGPFDLTPIDYSI